MAKRIKVKNYKRVGKAKDLLKKVREKAQEKPEFDTFAFYLEVKNIQKYRDIVPKKEWSKVMNEILKEWLIKYDKEK